MNKRGTLKLTIPIAYERQRSFIISSFLCLNKRCLTRLLPNSFDSKSLIVSENGLSGKANDRGGIFFAIYFQVAAT